MEVAEFPAGVRESETSETVKTQISPTVQRRVPAASFLQALALNQDVPQKCVHKFRIYLETLTKSSWFSFSTRINTWVKHSVPNAARN